METKKNKTKSCDTCLYVATYVATHDQCKDCLGSVEETRNGYLYKNWKEGDGIARIRQWEKEGKRNIVIGGMGEAEVNVKWTPEETLKRLYDVSEQCGYFTATGHWMDHLKEIYISTDSKYKLTYYNGKLNQIDKIVTIRSWTA